jgi:hypothetical protein
MKKFNLPWWVELVIRLVLIPSAMAIVMLGLAYLLGWKEVHWIKVYE